MFELSLRQPVIKDDGNLDGADRINGYADLILQKTKDNISILEIGVYKDSLTQRLFSSLGKKILTYTGVDPYLGDESDPYFSGYWKKDKSIAESTYTQVVEIYERLGATLIRKTSNEYFDKYSDLFDVVIIDGDHREEPAISDLRKGWSRVKHGGILIADDYANPDHPGVTRAVNKYDKECQTNNKGCLYTFFQKPPERLFAYPLGLAWWSK